MADVNSNTLVSSGHSMIMPMAAIADGFISLKNGAVRYDADEAGFYTALELDFTNVGFETATLTHAASGAEQTIVDTGAGVSGVLTQILGPVVLVPGIVTITVTIDGVDNVFTPTTNPPAGSKLCIGDFVSWAAQDSVTDAVGLGSYSNTGYYTTTQQEIAMITPLDSLMRGLPIGMAFTDSMKVTVQSTGSFTGGSATEKTAVAWVNGIPEGVE